MKSNQMEFFRKNLWALDYIEIEKFSNNEIMSLLKLKPELVKKVENPTQEMLWITLKENKDLFTDLKSQIINKINDFSDDFIKYVVNIEPEVTQYIDNSNEKLLMSIIRKNIRFIEHIQNPSIKMQKYIVDNFDVSYYKKDIFLFLNSIHFSILEKILDFDFCKKLSMNAKEEYFKALLHPSKIILTTEQQVWLAKKDPELIVYLETSCFESIYWACLNDLSLIVSFKGKINKNDEHVFFEKLINKIRRHCDAKELANSLIIYFEKDIPKNILNQILVKFDFLIEYFSKHDIALDMDIKKYLINKNPLYLEYLKNNEELNFLAVKNNGLAIQFVETQPEDLKQIAVKQNPHSIQYVNNPSEELLEFAINQDFSVAQYIPPENLSENLKKILKNILMEKYR